MNESLRAHIYTWAYRLLRNHDDALDATQDVLLKWMRRDPGVLEHPRAWLRRITVNHCIDLLRRHRRAVNEPVELIAPDDAADHIGRDELRQRIVRGLAELSEQQRAVLIAKVYDDETFAAIAASMGISVSSAKTHYLRALRTLRDQLRDFSEDAS